MIPISILIPMFNREKFIVQSIESILNQTYSNLEIIVYDDGSTDNSVKLVRTLMKIDSRIKLIIGNENKGVGYARNELLKACNTKYACWQDSDDISGYDRIKLQIKAMKKACLVFGSWSWLHWKSGKWIQKYKNTNNQAFATLMFPVNKTILFREDLRIGGEDWGWVKKMQEKYNSIEIPDRIYAVRYHEDRIGHWKKKFRREIPKKLLGKMGYAELIEYYKENFE